MDEQLTAAMRQLVCNVLKGIAVSTTVEPVSKSNRGIKFLIATMGNLLELTPQKKEIAFCLYILYH